MTVVETINSLPPFLWIGASVLIYLAYFFLRRYWLLIVSLVIAFIGLSLLFLPPGKNLLVEASSRPSLSARAGCLTKGVLRLAPWRQETVCPNKRQQQIDGEKLNRRPD